MDVPVNPVWPNEPSGNNSPRFDENEVFISHPSPRVAPSSDTTYGAVIFAMVWADNIRRCVSVPPAVAGGRALGRRVSVPPAIAGGLRSEEHTSELQSLAYLVC